MTWKLLVGVLIPFLGTSLGAACVFFLKNVVKDKIQKVFIGFAAGVMIAASIWSLIMPSLEEGGVIQTVIGFWLGIGFLLVLDHITPHLHRFEEEAEGPSSSFRRTSLLLLAVTIHNIPEGMAVGAVFAGFVTGNANISFQAALVLSIGIAIQNFPEGAIISMPLLAEGFSKKSSFVSGVLSGVVEPVAAVITILLAQLVIPFMPYFLSFAAGAMMYVVVEELIPEMSQGHHSDWGVISFSLGFSVMMILDVLLG